MGVAGGGMRSCGEGADLRQVVGEYAMPAPDPCAGQSVEAGAVPAGGACEVGDAAFAAGAPFDQEPEGSSVFGLAAGRAGSERDEWQAFLTARSAQRRDQSADTSTSTAATEPTTAAP